MCLKGIILKTSVIFNIIITFASSIKLERISVILKGEFWCQKFSDTVRRLSNVLGKNVEQNKLKSLIYFSFTKEVFKDQKKYYNTILRFSLILYSENALKNLE